MQTLNRNVLDDAIRTVEHTTCLSTDAKARLLSKLTLLKDSFCHRPCGCDGCAMSCACQRMVERLFAVEPDDRTPTA